MTRAVLFFFSFFLLLGMVSSKLYYSPGWRGMRIEEDYKQSCDYVADIALLVDVTHSQGPNLDGIKKSIDSVAAAVISKQSENRLALLSYTDKPIFPLGYTLDESENGWQDYCLKVHSPFGAPLSKFTRSVKLLRAGGGNDYPEGIFEAIVRTIMAPQVGWRSGGPSEMPGARVIVVVTDSVSHLPRQARTSAEEEEVKDVPGESIVRRPLEMAASPNAQCATTEYPSLEEVGQLIKDSNTMVVFLLAPQGYACKEERSGRCSYPEFERLAKEHKNLDYLDPIKGMDLLYKNYIDRMGAFGIIQHLENPRDFSRKLMEGLVDVEHQTCLSMYVGPPPPQ